MRNSQRSSFRHSSGATRALTLLLSCSVPGCTERAARGTVNLTIDTVNGAVRTRSTGSPPRWTLQELVTLGAGGDALQPAPDEFSFITGVIADGQHNIYVAEARAREIRVFDEQGRLVRLFGRDGAGPAEFRALQSIGWLGDTLVSMDAGNARIGLMTPTGEWQGQRAFSRMTGDAVRLYQTGPAELYSMARRRLETGLETVFVRQTHSGETDSIPVLRDPNFASRTVVCTHAVAGGDALQFFSPSFNPVSVRQPAPGTTLLAFSSADYRLHFLKPPDTVRIIERDLPRLPVTDEEWSGEQARFRAWHDSLPPDRKCEPASPRRPEAKALLHGVFFDDQGRTWVERQAGPAFAFDVFDANGRLLSELDAPARLQRVPVYIRGDRLYLVTTDSLDIQYVKAFRIVVGGPVSH